MKGTRMKSVLTPFLLAFLATAAAAETTHIDLGKLPSKQVHDVAQLTPLVIDADGAPAVVLLDLDKGVEVPPHATKSGVRLLTVLQGDMSWGDGTIADPEKERIYPQGSVLTIPAGENHWLAARNGPVRIQLIVLDDETPVPGIQEQMK